MDYEHIRVERGPVSIVSLNRPKLRNALSDKTLGEIECAFRTLSSEAALRCVIVRGEGQDFCAGADIEWMKRAGKLSPQEGKADAQLLAKALSAVDECPVPVIAAAQGNIFGGGLGLLAACDISVIADNAKLSFSECRLGILPAVVSRWVLPRIGASNARRYYLTAEVFGDVEALHMGLAHESVAPDKLEAHAAELAALVMKNGPQAVKTAKLLIRRLDAMPTDLRLDAAIEALVKLRGSPEGQEGLSAFLEKRAPSWRPPKR